MPVMKILVAGLGCYQFPLLSGRAGLVHGVFTREGGVSRGAFAGLNLSFAVGDRRADVLENRRRVREALGLAHLAGACQVHGNTDRVVEEGEPPGEGEELPEADILITATPGVGLLIKQADCQAVLLYDPERRVATNVHCGWRGQVQNVLGQAVARLVKEWGSRPQALLAGIGPGLGPCCAQFVNYRQEFPRTFWDYQVRPGYFDLWRLSRDQLLEAGLRLQHLEVAGLCTRCRPAEFFSYRRERLTGRQGAVIGLASG